MIPGLEKPARHAIEEAGETAKHFRGTSINARYATAHLSDVGKLWRNLVYNPGEKELFHDPTEPAAAQRGLERLRHPGKFAKELKTAYQEGKAGVGPVYSSFVRAGAKARKFVKGFESLDDYIAFKAEELKEKEEEVKGKLKKPFKKKGHRLHGGGT